MIVGIWEYLINASEKDINDLRDEEGKVPLWLTKPERDLLGFICFSGSERPRKSFSKWALRQNELEKHKKRIINLLPKIRHWKVMLGSYEDIDNEVATWFIDPPYQNAGKRYICSSKNIDFNRLGNWCREREGQVIVCENDGADWLDFKPLCSYRGGKKDSLEVMWEKKLI